MTMKQALAATLAATLTLLSGCGGGFFIDGTTSTTTTSTSGNYIYAVNSTTNQVNEYSLTAGALTLISGSPVTAATGLAAASVAVSRANTFVYVGGSQAISRYTIGSTGALTLGTATAATALANFVALETSPDGQWLLGLDSTLGSYAVYVYKINTSTGALTLTTTAGYTPSFPNGVTVTPRMLRISPTATFVAAALGPGGDVVFSFNTSTGALNFTSALGIAAGYSDNAVQFDGTGAYLFAARGATTTGSSLIAGYTVNSNGTLTTGTTLASGNAPYALLLENSGSYVYAANRSDATISGFSTSAGALTALSGSPYPSGSAPTALVEDRTHKYIVAAGAGGGADLTVYGLDAITGGKLGALATVTSGAAGLTSISATH